MCVTATARVERLEQVHHVALGDAWAVVYHLQALDGFNVAFARTAAAWEASSTAG